jgi:hypothetical protein
MRKLWSSFMELLRVMPEMVEGELRGLRNSFLWLLGFLYAMFIVQLVFPLGIERH